jgi:hydrogenase nickel incorporation protein HypA/HybF
VHELSIADAVTRIVCDHAGGRRVTRVWLRVGHLRQVVPSALTFAFELVAQGTPAEGAELEIEQVPAIAHCRGCAGEARLEGFPAACTACGALDVEVIGGEELLVESLELEEAPATGAVTAPGYP